MNGKRIYTRFGDDGSTSLLAGGRIMKDNPRIEACGSVDEVNSVMGVLRTAALEEKLADLASQLGAIQNALFDLGAELAARKGPQTADEGKTIIVQKLEGWSDELQSKLPPLKSFILPGGSRLNAEFHLARSVCRRAERALVALSHQEPIPSGSIPFLNRLSDFLFLLARYDTVRTGAQEFIWQKGVPRGTP